MVRRVKFSLRGECKRKEKAEKISLNFPHRENCCFPITMKNNIFISTWISYPLRSWYVFARAISNQTTVNLEVTVFSQAKHKYIRILLSKASKDWLWCIIIWAFIFPFTNRYNKSSIISKNNVSEYDFRNTYISIFHQWFKSIKNKSLRM